MRGRHGVKLPDAVGVRLQGTGIARRVQWRHVVCGGDVAAGGEDQGADRRSVGVRGRGTARAGVALVGRPTGIDIGDRVRARVRPRAGAWPGGCLRRILVWMGTKNWARVAVRLRVMTRCWRRSRLRVRLIAGRSGSRALDRGRQGQARSLGAEHDGHGLESGVAACPVGPHSLGPQGCAGALTHAAAARHSLERDGVVGEAGAQGDRSVQGQWWHRVQEGGMSSGPVSQLPMVSAPPHLQSTI